MRERDIEPNVIERKAAEYVRTRNGLSEPDHRERTEEEVRTLKRIERATIIRAAMAGIISGGLIGGSEVIVMEPMLDDAGDGWRDQMGVWAGFLVFTGAVSVIEILFLYWNSLRATAKASRIAGLGLLRRDARLELVPRALGRAAMELPNPHAEVFGIDPLARTAKWRIYAWMLLYRAKVGVSSLVSRVLLRRVLGRAALRSFAPLVAGPLYAVWNALITWRITREVRVRAFGPMAVATVTKLVERRAEEMDTRDRALLIAAVGEMIILSQDDHPNFVLLVGSLLDTLDLSPEEVEVDWQSQRKRLKDMPPRSRQAVLMVLLTASVLDRRLRGPHRRVLEDAHRRAGLPLDERAFRGMRRRLLNGRLLRDEDFESIWREASVFATAR